MYQKSRDDLLKEFGEQLEALRSSSESYDSGKRWEAKRIAAIAYILLHDGGRKSRSLLGQLGKKPSLVSSKRKNPDAPLPLAIVQISPFDGAWYQPNLNSFPEHHEVLRFGKWYEQVIFESGHLRLSRKNLIHTFRSQMGGSHVDQVLSDEAFHWLKNVGPIRLGSVSTEGEEEYPDELKNMYKLAEGNVPFGPEATMRQIGWEIETSFQNFLSGITPG